MYEYEVQGNYGQGWELLTCDETREAAKLSLADYDNNEAGYAHRIRKVKK